MSVGRLDIQIDDLKERLELGDHHIADVPSSKGDEVILG